MLVGGVAVEDDMDRPIGRDVALDSIEEENELEVAVALHAAADHGAVEHAERGKQVVVPPAFVRADCAADNRTSWSGSAPA
jgi:hypothetical protein